MKSSAAWLRSAIPTHAPALHARRSAGEHPEEGDEGDPPMNVYRNCGGLTSLRNSYF